MDRISSQEVGLGHEPFGTLNATTDVFTEVEIEDPPPVIDV
jgi:hypothetical protein